ncbi:MAG: hypothetical protein ACREJU_09660 [Nitrospiraceae bacterium]
MTASEGGIRLSRARVRLDWGQWVGLKPGGLINETVLDLSKKAGWERLQADDLRQMAARALQVPLEEVRFFYGDEDLHIDARGQATIRHKKDAFYVLDDGTFDAAPDRVRFMACMGAMHWHRIDFLPVVELFQSLLPGTGSAVFELIRGLYDDQNEQSSQPLPLRYRGIPTYPSEAAFRLFSGFFVPHAPVRQQAFNVFTDPSRSHEVAWLPSPDPPLRYFDATRRLCVTMKRDIVQKATLADDQAGLSFLRAEQGRAAPYQRSVAVAHGKFVLRDEDNRAEIPIPQNWKGVRDSAGTQDTAQDGHASRGPGWRALLGGTLPPVSPMESFSAVLLYPEDDREIGELSTQPFVADYLHDLMEDVPALVSHLARVNDVLIDSIDAALTTCINLSRFRTHTILYHYPAYAQKQAQTLWTLLTRQQLLDWVPAFRFLPAAGDQDQAYQRGYDLIYKWIAFADYTQTVRLNNMAGVVAKALNPGGLAFVVGPSSMRPALQASLLRIHHIDLVEQLPTFRMHQAVLPKARIKHDVTLFHLAKN